jgi:hypothetical protein
MGARELKRVSSESRGTWRFLRAEVTVDTLDRA